MQCYVNSCQLLGKFKFCFLDLSGIFPPKKLSALVESTNVEPMDTETNCTQ